MSTRHRVSSSSPAVLGAALGFWLSLYADATVLAQNGSPPTPAAPKPPIAIDLSGARTHTWPVDPGTYRIVLYNAIPGMRYVVRSGAAEVAEVPTLVFPAGSALPMPATGTGGTGCQAALGKVKQLFTATEKAVPTLQQEIRAELAGCTGDPLAYVNAVLAQTVYESGLEVQMPNDARRTLTVARGAEEWNVTLTTLLRGRLQTLFGWAFAPDNDEEYFSEAGPNNQFIIRRKADSEGGLTNLPSVFFTWLPTSQAFNNIQHGPTLGLGVTAGEPGARASFLGGWMVRWNQNLGIVFGAAIYPHRRLDGKYQLDQTIATNLESLQLNRNEWRFNGFFGGVFRFGSDPRKAPTPPSTGK